MTDPEGFRSTLIDGLETLGFENSSSLADRLLRFAEIVLEENQRTNLIGAKSLDQMVRLHLLDSLAATRGVGLHSPVIDLGSGAGFPGVPHAMAYPKSGVVLLEPRKKRVDFLSRAVTTCGLTNVRVEQVTAETAGRSGWRGRAGSVLVRAVAKPLVALELSIPLLKRGGKLVLFMGKEARPSALDIRVARELGAEPAEVRQVQVPFLDADRHVWIFRKIGATPPQYPRRSGLPAKEPLTLQ